MIERPAALAVAVGVLLATSPGTAPAEVHRWVGPDGVVSYSDRPPRPADLTAPAPERARASEPAPPGSPVTVAALFELSGLRAQLAGVTARLAREFKPPDGRVSAPEQAAIQRAVSATLSADRLYRLVYDDVARHADAARLQAKGAWLASPLGRTVTAAEQRETGIDADARIAAFGRSLIAQPPSARRRELIERLDWVSGASDVSAEIVAGLAGSVARAGAAAAPPHRRTPARHIENQVTELRARGREPLRESAIVSLLYTYRELSDDELEQWLSFESSDAGRWYNRVLRQALVRSLLGVFDETARAVFKAVPPGRWVEAPPPSLRQSPAPVKLAR